MNKKETRKNIASLKAAMSTEQRAAEEKIIWNAVEVTPEFAAAECILVYCSLPDEVDTSEFIRRWMYVKNILVPLVSGDGLVLKEFIPGRTHKGYRDIQEPDNDIPPTDPADVKFAIIPGVAFTKEGIRLGRGKGFYDRLLPSLRCKCVGVCYDCQISETLPSDVWDKKVDAVICPCNIHNSECI